MSYERLLRLDTDSKVILNRNTVFLFFFLFLFFSFLFFFPIDLRLACLLCVVLRATRYLCRISLFCYYTAMSSIAVWRTGDVVKKIPIPLYHIG